MTRFCCACSVEENNFMIGLICKRASQHFTSAVLCADKSRLNHHSAILGWRRAEIMRRRGGISQVCSKRRTHHSEKLQTGHVSKGQCYLITQLVSWRKWASWPHRQCQCDTSVLDTEALYLSYITWRINQPTGNGFRVSTLWVGEERCVDLLKSLFKKLLIDCSSYILQFRRFNSTVWPCCLFAFVK